MHLKLEDLPIAMEAPGTKMQMQQGWGGMAVSFNQMPPMPRESAAMFKGLPNDSCPVPHWGYMVKGSMHLRFDNGEEEVIKAGDVFYIPDGHVGWSDEEMSWIEFSPEKELKVVMDHLAKVMR